MIACVVFLFCGISILSFITVTSSPIFGCLDDWVSYEGSCYLFGHKMPMTFNAAELYCKQHDAHLINVGNSSENAFLKDYMDRLTNNDFWLGLTDEVTEGEWKWSDTNTVAYFTDWYPGQPNNPGHNRIENCAVMYNGAYKFGYRWGDISCDNHYQPACERREMHGGDGGEIVG